MPNTASSHGGEERISGVLLGPDADQSTRIIAGVSRYRRVSSRPLRRESIRGAQVPGESFFCHATRKSVVCIGTGHQSELKGVHAQATLFPEAFDQSVAGIAAFGDTIRTQMRDPVGKHSLVTFTCLAPTLERKVLEFFEIAELIGPTEYRRDAVTALGVPLVLHDFEKPLQTYAQPCALALLLQGAGPGVVHRKHASITDIGIMRNCKNVAGALCVETFDTQAFP